MTPPAYLSEYHECHFCQRMIIGLDGTLPEVKGLTSWTVFHLEPTLQAVLAAESTCFLARWLCKTWSKSIGLRRGRGDRTIATWDELLLRSADVRLFGAIDDADTKFIVILHDSFNEHLDDGAIAGGIWSERMAMFTDAGE